MRRVFVQAVAIFFVLICAVPDSHSFLKPRFRGVVNALADERLPEKATFRFAVENLAETPSLADRRIQSLIVRHLAKHGWEVAATDGTAEYLVSYSYQVGEGHTEVTGTPNAVYGTTDISSGTLYPRRFTLSILKNAGIDTSERAESIVWQVEVSSEGSNFDFNVIAADALQAAFSYWGLSVTNKRFNRSASRDDEKTVAEAFSAWITNQRSQR